MGQATGARPSKKSLKSFNTLQEYKDAVNRVMALMCNETLDNVPDNFDTEARYKRGDDPAQTARDAYAAIEA